MNSGKIAEEYGRLYAHYTAAGAEELKLKICEPLILECARAKVQLDDLNAIVEQTGLVIYKPDRPQMQKALPVAAEISRLRASLTSMSYKLVHILCIGADEEDDGLAEFE